MAAFWTGADVVWAGPPTQHGGRVIRVGDRAVVIDAGPHHVTSFTMLTAGDPPNGNRVTIELPGGTQLDVDPGHLRHAVRDHPLQPSGDAAAARWWLTELEPWGAEVSIASFLPRSIPAVCFLLHPWTTLTGDVLLWSTVAGRLGLDSRALLAERLVQATYSAGPTINVADVQEPEEGHLPIATAQILVSLLRTATSTPDAVYVAVWEGWGDVPPAAYPGAARLSTRSRGHFLLHGPIDGVLESVAVSPSGGAAASGIWWPEDRAWMVHTEADFHWTLIAGDDHLIQTLQSHRQLETIPADHDAPANRLPT